MIWGSEAGTTPDPRPGDPVAELMVVCTANICRSPLAEAMLRREAERRVGPEAPVRVTSSGVHGLAGEPAAPLSVVEAERRGLDLTGHVATITDEARVWRSDLVITMSESQRAKIVRLVPQATRRTFTIRELARLLSALKPVEDELEVRERVRFVARLAHGARAYVARSRRPEDVRDPYGGPPEGYERTGRQLDELVAVVAPQLFGWRHDDPR